MNADKTKQERAAGLDTGVGSLAPGTVVDGRYEIVQFVGKGGMSAVYKAQHLQLDKTIALKVLLTSRVEDNNAVQRFRRESQAVAALQHPNILRAYGFGVFQNQPYLAIEFLEGESLSDRLKRCQRLDPDSFTHIMTQICDALAFAHSRGIIHRDLKPSNVMLLANDQVRLVDFGIAKILPESGIDNQKLTQTGTVVGTLTYASPEQCEGRETDARSDIYSLGCMMYQALEGKPPFEADTPFAMIFKHLNDPPPPGEHLGQFGTLIHACLAKDKDERPQSADVVKQSLGTPERCNVPTSLQKHSSSRLKLPRLKSSPAAIAWLFLVALASLAYVLTYAWQHRAAAEYQATPRTYGELMRVSNQRSFPMTIAELEETRAVLETAGEHGPRLNLLLGLLAYKYQDENQHELNPKLEEIGQALRRCDYRNDAYSPGFFNGLGALGLYYGLTNVDLEESKYWCQQQISFLKTSFHPDPEAEIWPQITLCQVYDKQGDLASALKCARIVMKKARPPAHAAQRQEYAVVAGAHCIALANQPSTSRNQQIAWLKEALSDFEIALSGPSPDKAQEAQAGILAAQKLLAAKSQH